MATFVNRAKVSTSTTGTGTITLGAAEDGYQTFAAAGVGDGDSVRYTIEDGNNWEIGTGTYTASGTTLSRTPSESSNAGAAINLSGNAVVFVTALATDFTSPTYTNLTATGTVSFSGATVSDLGTVTTANIDGGDIASAVTINKSPTVTLSGDATGSATFTNLGNATLAVTVVGGDVDTATSATTATTATSAGKWTTARTVSLTGAVTGSASVDGSANVSIATTATSDPTITLTGAVTGSGTMTNLGNVSITTTATSDPTLTLSGDATGSATFTNLGNATLTVAVVNDSHTHAFNNLTGKTSGTGDYRTTGNFIGGSGTPTGSVIGNIRSYGATSAYIGASDGAGRTAFMGVDSSGYAMFGAFTNHDTVLRANNAEVFRAHTAGYTTSTGSSRAPIFYDSNNTGYYTDPASTSVMNHIRLEGVIDHNGDTNTYIQFHAADQFRVVTGGSERLEVNNTATTGLRIDATSDMRAPIFYDRNNTAYYIHADSTSILNNLRYNPDPGSISTAAHEGSINYVYNSAGGTPTRGDCSVHVYQQWNNNLSLSLTSSTWQRGDIVRVSNVYGAVNITVSAAIIYLPNGSSDTSVTFNSAVGGFVLAKYSTTTGYWMVLPT